MQTLYVSQKFNFDLNKEIIKLTICYLKDTERFDKSLICNIFFFYLLLLSLSLLFYCFATLIFDIYLL